MGQMEIPTNLKLSDLEVNKVFDEIELIIESDRCGMKTVSWQGGIEEGREYSMRFFMYDISSDREGNVLRVNNSGYSELFDDDPLAKEYARRLNNAGLFEEK